MSYEYIRKYTSPNQTPGRPWGIKSITIHYWDDPRVHPTFRGVVNEFMRPTKKSAHYVAEAGKVACLVAPSDRAWHAGDGIGRGRGNDTSIGIECNPRRSQGDLETVAELIADLRRAYGNLPLFPHNHWHSTSCPGSWEQKIPWLDKRANEILRGAKSAAAQPKEQPSPRKDEPEMNAEETRILHEINARTKRLEDEVFGMNPLDDTNALGLANFCRRVWRAVRPPAGKDSTQPANAAWNTFAPWREIVGSSKSENE